MNYFKAHSESLDASDFEKFYEYSSLKVWSASRNYITCKLFSLW
jgi:hypothetical protein